jgi:hypothetical protein
MISIPDIMRALSQEWAEWVWSPGAMRDDPTGHPYPAQWIVRRHDDARAEVVIVFKIDSLDIQARGYDWRVPPGDPARHDEEILEVNLHDPSSFQKLKAFIERNIG